MIDNTKKLVVREVKKPFYIEEEIEFVEYEYNTRFEFIEKKILYHVPKEIITSSFGIDSLKNKIKELEIENASTKLLEKKIISLKLVIKDMQEVLNKVIGGL